MSKPCENCGSDFKVCISCDLYNGKYIEILNNATNGDMIKSIFPNMRVGKLHDCIFAKDYKNVWFGEDWWNAPYKAESE